jgi:predicted secreted protein
MATYLGREGLVKISSTTVGELRNYALTLTSDTVEDTQMGDTFRTRKGSLSTFGVTADVFYDADDSGQALVTVGATVTINLYPEGAAAAETYYSGSAIVTQFNISASFDGLIEASIAFEGNGALSTLTV